MVIKSERMTVRTEAELARQRLDIVVRLLEKVRKERDALLAQIFLLKTSNAELSEYARVFHLDEKVEKEDIEEAKKSADETAGAEEMAMFDAFDTVATNMEDMDFVDV